MYLLAYFFYKQPNMVSLHHLVSVYFLRSRISLINSSIGLHKVLTMLNFEGEACEDPLQSQAHFVMCLVERGFISKVNS